MTDIAVVGLDCRFPHAADPAQLWQLLIEGRDAISEVPSSRWNADDFHDPAGAPGTINTRSGGFIDDADAFDAEFFGITPTKPSRWTRNNACYCRPPGEPSRTPRSIPARKPARGRGFTSG